MVFHFIVILFKINLFQSIIYQEQILNPQTEPEAVCLVEDCACLVIYPDDQVATGEVRTTSSV